MRYRIRLVRRDTSTHHRCKRRAVADRRARVLLAGGAALAMLPLATLPVLASNSVTLAVPIATLSVTVSPSALSPSTCVLGATNTPVLNFPNGICRYPGITVTNTSTAATAHIDVQGADAVPSDGGKHWALVPGGAGADQFQEVTGSSTAVGPALTTSPQCDLAFNGDSADHCSATPNQASTEQVNLQGPTVSSDLSASFTTTVTWTAVQ